MKFLDLLAKLGILRDGAKAAVYHSGRDGRRSSCRTTCSTPSAISRGCRT
jgi:hypothetical protein